MKKRLPGTVWQAIQPLIDQYRHLVVPVVAEDAALYLKDADPESNFFFQCKRVTGTSGVDYEVQHLPSSTSDNSINRGQIAQPEVARWLKQWLEALALYEKTETIYDDPLLKSYEKEFASFFVMKDQDADKAPFALQKQLYLDQHLSNIRGLLERARGTATPEQGGQLDVLAEASEALKTEMTGLTKNQTIGRLAKIWAMARKYSISLIKDVLNDFAKDGIKALIEKGTAIDFSDFGDLTGLIS